MGLIKSAERYMRLGSGVVMPPPITPESRQPVLGEIAIQGNDLVQIRPIALNSGGQKQIFWGTFTNGREFILQQYFPKTTDYYSEQGLVRGRNIDFDTKNEMTREGSLTTKVESMAFSMGVPSPVPHIYGPVNDREGRFIGVATEFIHGVSLEDRLPHISLTEAFSYMRQLVRALSVFERADIVHRDLDLGNILVDEKGRIRILDLGVALVDGKECPPGEMLRRTNGMGKVGNAAPETRKAFLVSAQEYVRQSIYEQHVQTDMYGLGVAFWELLTRQSYHGFLSRDFDRDYQMERYLLDESASPERLSRMDNELLLKGIPFKMREVVLRMVQYRQEDRYKDTRILEHELEGAIGDYFALFGGRQRTN